MHTNLLTLTKMVKETKFAFDAYPLLFKVFPIISNLGTFMVFLDLAC